MIAVEPLTLRMKQLRTKQMLVQAPDLVAHMLSLVSPGAGSGGGEGRVGGTKEIPLPLNAQALDDANGLYAMLVNFAISHARALGAMPPSIALGWSRRDLDCDGFPSWASIEDATALTFDIADWLVLGGDRIAGLPAAGNYFDDVREVMGPLFGRYPTAPRRLVFASRGCPVCERRTVIVNFGDADEVTVACAFCGHVVPSAGHVRFVDPESLDSEAGENR